MSQRLLAILLMTTLVGACGGNPFGATNLGGGEGSTDENPGTINPGTGPGGAVATPIDTDLAWNVNAVAYDGTRLQMAVDGLDGTPALVEFTRYPGLDVPGYRAYKVQEDALDRMFVALAAQSQDGSTRAVTVADGGQFGQYFGGGYYERTGGFDPPHIGAGPGAGQVSYAGNYAGVTNLDAPGNPDALPVAPGTSPAVIPDQPARVTGDIFMNVNFADNLVNGTIYNRVITDVGFSLDDVLLIATDIRPDGTFSGTTEGGGANRGDVAGEYGGIFGGNDSASVAGIVRLTAFDDALDNEQEHGVFVLTECSLQPAGGICDQVAPP